MVHDVRFPQTPPQLLDDWWQTMARRGEALGALLRPRRVQTVLDVACGTGCHAIGLARHGFLVTACDGDADAVAEAERRATEAEASVAFGVVPLAAVGATVGGAFDALLCLDGAFAAVLPGARLPLLRDLAARVGAGGLLLLGLPDWETILRERPQFIPRRITKPNGSRLVMFDVWDYGDGEAVSVSSFTLRDTLGRWTVETEKRTLYPLRPADLFELAAQAGLRVTEQVQRRDETWWVLQVRRGRAG